MQDLHVSRVGRHVRYEQLRLDEIGRVIAECPIAYLAVGPMEAHGPHGPLGLDALKAYGICLLAADRFGGAVYPPVFTGQQAVALVFAGNVYVTPETARALYRDLLTCLERTGFEVIVLLAGHYPEEPLIRDVANAFMVNGRTPVLALTEKEVAAEVMQGESDHGGKWETSMMLAMYPELVDMALLPADRSVTPPAMLSTDARDASAELGRQAVAAAVDRIGRMATHLLAQRRAGSNHGALFAQFRRLDLLLAADAGRKGIDLNAEQRCLEYRQAFWSCDFERADRAQQALWRKVRG